MINNEDGGIILIGVQDNGLIDGLVLSNAQQEHVVANIINTFDRYRPKVPHHFYEINFIPVKLTMDSKAKEEKAHQSDDTSLPHLLRTTKLCCVITERCLPSILDFSIKVGSSNSEFTLEIVLIPERLGTCDQQLSLIRTAFS